MFIPHNLLGRLGVGWILKREIQSCVYIYILLLYYLIDLVINLN